MGLLRRAAGEVLSRLIALQVLLARGVAWLCIPSVRQSGTLDTGQVQRILVIRLDEIGDAVLNTGLLRELRRTFPTARMTLIVKPAVYSLVAPCPYVDSVVSFNQSVSRLWRPLVLPFRCWQFARSLRAEHYDLALVPLWEVDTCYAGFLALFSGARWRIGFTERFSRLKRSRNRGFDGLYTHLLTGSLQTHAAENNLALVRFLGGTPQEERLELWTEPEDDRSAVSLLESSGVAGASPLIALGIGCGNSPLKQWPLERFGELANRIRETSPTARFLLVGGPEDREKCRVVAEAIGESAINLASRTSLRELTALLRRCTLFIGNDTGAMHISAAVDLPVIALFGPTCAHRYAPWSGHTVLQIPLGCSPCQQPDHPHRCLSCPYEQPLCLQQLTVESVLEAARIRLARTEPVNIR